MQETQKLFQEFLWECEYARKLRPETLRGYSEVFLTFTKLVPEIGLNDIGPATLTSFFKLLNERKRIVGRGTIKVGIKKSTVATYWSKLNSFFTWLEHKHHIASNPLRQMRYPAPKYEDRKYLRKDQVEKIFTAIYIHHDGNLLILKRNILLFNLLLFCGLRREELILLQIRDVDIERKIITIRSENSKSATMRQIPLTMHVTTVLKDYLAERKKYTTQFLFVSSTSDRQFSSDGLTHLVVRLNKLAKVRFHLHQFRHTFAVNFLRQSNNVYKLKELLGHKDISMTAIYLRCLPVDELRGDVEKMSIDSLL